MKKLIASLFVFVAALFSTLAMAASLNDAQTQTLAAALRADTDPAVVTARTQRNDAELARLYNADTTFIVWRTAVYPQEYREAIVWTAVDALSAGKARIWEWITQGMTASIDATKTNIRQGIADAWGASSATGLALQGISKRPASKAEKLYVTGTGTTANPGLLTWEGPLSVNDVSRALNEF